MAVENKIIALLVIFAAMVLLLLILKSIKRILSFVVSIILMLLVLAAPTKDTKNVPVPWQNGTTVARAAESLGELLFEKLGA